MDEEQVYGNVYNDDRDDGGNDEGRQRRIEEALYVRTMCPDVTRVCDAITHRASTRTSTAAATTALAARTAATTEARGAIAGDD